MMKQQIETKEKQILKQLKNTLKKSEERYRSLYVRTPAIQHSIDDNGRLLDVSDSWLDKFGYKKEEVIGRKAVEFLTEDSKHYAESVAIPEFMKKGNIRDIHYQFVKKNGEIVEVLLSAITEWDEDGNYSRSLAILTDISKQRNAEEALEKSRTEVEKAINRLQPDDVYVQDEFSTEHNFKEIIGVSKDLKKVLVKVEQVSPTDTTVLILGETGTGKELIARAVHSHSVRQERPLVIINCAALPNNLIESELFGHEKGAFTGAFKQKIGRFELADGGTIFLDEIGELPTEIQVKLLRVLQEGELERLGSSNTLKVDVRIIAATSRNLEKMMADGDFLEGLYYRLNVFPIKVPPLRERKEEIPLLAKHFVEKFSIKMGKKIKEIPKKLMDALQIYDWPGNVRELENVIERLMVISDGNLLEIDEWSLENIASYHTFRVSTLKEIEIEHITKTLESTDWRVRGSYGAAKILGIKPSTLEARMKKLGILRKR